MKNLGYAFLAVALSGCYEMKPREDKILVVGDSGAQVNDSTAAAAAAGESGAVKAADGSVMPVVTEDQVTEIANVYNTYAGAEGVTKDQLNNIIQKTQGSNDGKTADVIFSLAEEGGNTDDKATPKEVLAGIYASIPTMAWIAQGEALTREEIRPKVQATYLAASATAIDGLLDVLFRYDEPWVGGNGDGKLTRMETEIAGLIIGSMDDEDYTNNPPTGADAPGGPTGGEDLQAKILETKLNKQLFLRYPVVSIKQLALADRQLEWVAFALRALLADTMAQLQGGTIPAENQAAALATMGYAFMNDSADGYLSLRKYYDNKINFGDGDGALNTIEVFNLISDLDFTVRLNKALGGDFSAANVEQRKELKAALKAIYPKTGPDTFFDPKVAEGAAGLKARNEYWDSLITFDDKKRGGNGDSKVNVGELAMAMVDMQLLEGLYLVFDRNSDIMMQKEEAYDIFRLFELENPQTVDLFYSEAALHPDASPLQLLILKNKKKDSLSPWDFYQRMEKLLERGGDF